MRLRRYRGIWLDGAGWAEGTLATEVLTDLGFSLLVLLLHRAITLETGCSQHNETICSPSRSMQPVRGRDVPLGWPARPSRIPLPLGNVTVTPSECTSPGQQLSIRCQSSGHNWLEEVLHCKLCDLMRRYQHKHSSSR